jgi:hypothetical protein
VTAVELGWIARAAISALAPIQLLPEDERELAASLMVGKAIIHGGCRIPLDWLRKRDHERRLANKFTLLCDVIAELICRLFIGACMGGFYARRRYDASQHTRLGCHFDDGGCCTCHSTNVKRRRIHGHAAARRL